MSKDKEYIVDKPVDVTLTEDEKLKLRQKKVPASTAKGHNRQDLFADRRDSLADKKYQGPDRRKSNKDRRDDGGK